MLACATQIDAPLLSIVIANYNYGRFLPGAIESVLSQSCKDFELIICDAASKDNSVEVIKRYTDLPPNTDSNTVIDGKDRGCITWWCSEKDMGQSDAFNKGFAHAHGLFVTWLNADEYYTKDTIQALADYVKRHPDADWITSNSISYYTSDYRISYVNWGPHHPLRILSASHTSNAVFGPSSFMRRSMYEAVGKFDVDMHYSLDYAYWNRLLNAGYRQSRMNRLTWGFGIHQESKTAGQQSDEITKKRNIERRNLAEKYGEQFRHVWNNPWYWLFMFVRLIEGSLFVGLFVKFIMKGKDIRTVSSGRYWRDGLPNATDGRAV